MMTTRERRFTLLAAVAALVLLVPGSAAATAADDAATRTSLTLGWYVQGRDRTGPGQPGIDPLATFPIAPDSRRADRQAVDARDATADLRHRMRQAFATPTRPLYVWTVGDSITVGGNSIDGRGYRGWLVDILDRRDVTATLRLVGGNGLGLAAVTTAVTAVLPATGTDIVVVNVGTNDAYGPATAAWGAAYDALIASILASSPTVRVVITTLILTDTIWHATMATNEKAMNVYINAAYTSRVAGGRVALADWSVIRSSLLCDGPGLHPCDPGYLEAAQLVDAAIAPWLP